MTERGGAEQRPQSEPDCPVLDVVWAVVVVVAEAALCRPVMAPALAPGWAAALSARRGRTDSSGSSSFKKQENDTVERRGTRRKKKWRTKCSARGCDFYKRLQNLSFFLYNAIFFFYVIFSNLL